MTIRTLALAGACLMACSSAANAAVADFETKQPFYCGGGNQTDGGLNFASGFAACFYGPSNNADFPTPNTSNVIGIGYSDTTVTTVSGDAFDLSTVDLAFGPFGHGGRQTDTTTVIGTLAAGGTLQTVLTVGYGFQTYALNWKGLNSVTFGQLTGSEYLAFDNVRYDLSAAVPEPAAWALMIGGFGLVGGALRRRASRIAFA